MAFTRMMARATNTTRGSRAWPCTKPLANKLSCNTATSAKFALPPSDSIKNTTAEMSHAGMVVCIMFLICSNKSMPTILAAMLVVSDNGDILSPKSAPETTAPATMAGLALKASVMPKNATPTVAQVVKPLPSATPITLARIKADK